MDVITFIVALVLVKSSVSATHPKPTAVSTSWYDATINAFSTAVHAVTGYPNADATANAEGKSETHPRSTTSPSSWYDVTKDTLFTAFYTITGDSAEENIAQEWQPFHHIVETARKKVMDTLDALLPGDYEEVAGLQANFETLRENLPDLSTFGIDLSRVHEHVNEWSWDEFIMNISNIMQSYSASDSPLMTYSGIPPECGMSVPEMIRFYGYKCEIHTVETNDDYLLELHRIPFGRNGPGRANKLFKNRKRPIVFFQHGVLADSSCWIMNGPGRSLPLLLADVGCDVWLGNVRGSTYSRKHQTLNPDYDEEYWRFTWQHMSQSDLPAMIDKTLHESGQSSLYYVGHSQGTLIAFAKLADDPSFNHKIKMMFAFAPVSTLGHITSPFRGLVGLGNPVHVGMSIFGGAEVLPKRPLSQWISAQLHKLHQTSFNDTLAYHGSNLLLYTCGCHVDHYYSDRLPVYLSHTPAGTSLQNLLHMGQLVSSGKMQKWDFLSEAENKKAYGQVTAPEYDIKMIRTEIALFVGSEDQLANPEDAKQLSENIQYLHHYELIKGWDHLDFLWGREAKDTVYAKVLDTITNLEPSLSSNLYLIPNDEL